MGQLVKIRHILIVFLLILILPLGLNCGSSSVSAEGTGTDGTDGGSEGGTDGTTGGDTTGQGFQVTGALSSLVPLGLSLKDAGDTNSVTDVVAVSPATGGVTCTVTPVNSDTRAFSFWMRRRRPWLIYFINRQRSGWSMFMGRYRSGGMDTLTATDSAESTDLGSVTIDSATETATSDNVESSTLISNLGLDSDTAGTLADQDDIATRYTNPDMDGNGQIDCSDSDSSDGAGSSSYMLDFHVRFNMKENGSSVTVSDLIDSFLDSSATTASYADTGIYVAYLNTFSSATTGSVTFSDSNVTTEEGGAVTAGTATTDVTKNSFGSYLGFGPNIAVTSELPSGEYIFRMGDKTLTYSNVQVPTLAQLNAPTGRIFPFIKFNKTDSSCSSNCTLSGVSYKWMKKTADGWSLATLAEVALIVTESDTATTNNGAYLGFRVDGDANKTVGFVIPASSIEGAITWSSSSAHLEGVTAAEFNAVATTQICHVGLSYDDKLGMRYFENIWNAAGTCAGDS